MTRQPPPKTRRRIRGLSMVELLVALALGLVVTAGVIQVFISTRQGHRVIHADARLQENGRFALFFLQRDLRHAGLMGCADLPAMSPARYHDSVDADDYASHTGKATGTFTFNQGDTLAGHDDLAGIPSGSVLDALGLAVGGDDGDVVAGSDALVLRSADSCPGGTVTNACDNCANLQIQSAAACNLGQDDLVVVTDCEKAERFAITNNPQSAGAQSTLTHGANVNDGSKLQFDFSAQRARVFRFDTTVFYLAFADPDDTGPRALAPTLYRWRLSEDSAEPLIPDVEDLQLAYGEDTDGDGSPDYYTDAGQVTDMSQVTAVRLSLLLRSAKDSVATEPQDYTFAGSDHTADDRRLRRVFTTTVQLRNREP